MLYQSKCIFNSIICERLEVSFYMHVLYITHMYTYVQLTYLFHFMNFLPHSLPIFYLFSVSF